MRTEKDIGAKNSETTTVSRVRYAIFQSKFKRDHFPKTTFGEGLK